MRIGCISVKPSPSRWKFVDAVRETNRLLADYCRQNNLTFVDVFTPMIGADGKPRPELFLADNLHMTREGYRLWADVVRPYLPTR